MIYDFSFVYDEFSLNVDLTQCNIRRFNVTSHDLFHNTRKGFKTICFLFRLVKVL